MKSLMEQLLTRAIENVRQFRGGPFAAAVVLDCAVLAYGTENSESISDPTAHAEINSIRLACRAMQSAKLNGAQLWTIFEPCFMCRATLNEAGIASVHFALPLEFAAARGWIDLSIARPEHLRGTGSMQCISVNEGAFEKLAIEYLRSIPPGRNGHKEDGRIM